MMSRVISGAAGICSLMLLLAPPASAGAQDDACAALMEARGALVSLLDTKDKAVQGSLEDKMVQASTKLDGVLAGMTGADAKTAADFKAVWIQFKATRDTEIMGAVFSGKVEDAKKIAMGIQAERLAKMRSIMSCK